MWEGNVNFDKGRLKEALDLFRQAVEALINQKFEVASLQKVGITLERLGDYDSARDVCLRRLLVGGLDTLEEATANVPSAGSTSGKDFPTMPKICMAKPRRLFEGRVTTSLWAIYTTGLGLIRKGRGSIMRRLNFINARWNTGRSWSIFTAYRPFILISATFTVSGETGKAQHKGAKYQSHYGDRMGIEVQILVREDGDLLYHTSLDHILLARLHVKDRQDERGPGIRQDRSQNSHDGWQQKGYRVFKQDSLENISQTGAERPG